MAIRRFLRRRPLLKGLRGQEVVTKTEVDSFIYDLETLDLDITYTNGEYETLDHVSSIEFSGDVVVATCTPSSLEVDFRSPGGTIHVR